MSKKIIIVDDSSTIRRLVRMALSGGDFEFIEAKDGIDGLEKLSENQDAAIMICDVNMPRMNGLDMIEAVRREPVHDKLPLMMMTTEGQAEKLACGKKAGAQAWIIKPFQPAMLLEAVARLTGPQAG